MAADWEKIKADHLANGTSYRDLGEKYGVNFATIGRKASKEGWSTLRQQQVNKTINETLTAATNNCVDRVLRLNNVSDLLLSKIEHGIASTPLLTPTAANNYSNALKNIKEIQMIRSAEDLEEQRARIDKLRKDTERGDQSASITVTLEGGMAEYGR